MKKINVRRKIRKHRKKVCAMKSVITLRKLNKDYITRGETVHALKNISFDIGQGEFVSIIGQSGSGKSTLMNIIGCLDYPDSGEYILDGIDITHINERKTAYIRSRVIGFIFQSFNLIPSLSAIENVELPLIYRGISKSVRISAAEKALAQVGLSSRKNHRPTELSGGQQQRTAIARAIAAEPKILLADEPTGSLDKASGNDVLEVIESMNREGVTVVMITHDNDIAARAKRSIKISDGRIIS